MADMAITADNGRNNGFIFVYNGHESWCCSNTFFCLFQVSPIKKNKEQCLTEEVLNDNYTHFSTL